ncbi:SpoIIE family protein phosphatase [Streptomyces mangrovisoli]|uniref:PAS domain-containing protein n=1 Tax=Streptomyces mangrovisoli TaxID=1428628 RepID=A0A1J4NUR9_9ACTN|nr:SpoIIE family protein phosphatase [Streptomyces mangrovisoli]OIJ64981.1 hypothetical protein WN71_026235 [Streptomyces mangrovisoli]
MGLPGDASFLKAQPSEARFVLDSRGLVTQWSPSAERLLGYAADQAVGRHIASILDPQPPSGPRTDAAEDLVARHSDGRPVPVRAAVRLLTGSGDGLHWAVRLTQAAGTQTRQVPPTKADAAPDELDAALLRALLTDSPLGLQVIDADLRIARLNVSGPGVRGAVGEEAVGRPIRDVAPGLVDDAIEQRIRHVLAHGQPVIALRHVGRPPTDPHHDHVYTVTLLPLRAENQDILGVLVASQDVTEQERANARLDLVVEAGTRIGTTLDVTATAEELAAVVVPALADIATVDVLEDVLHGEAFPPGPLNAQVPMRRVAFATAHRRDTPPAWNPGERVRYLLPSFVTSLTELRPVLVPHLHQQELPGDDPRSALIRADGAHSLMVLPLACRGVVLGLASFYRLQNPGPYQESDLRLAGEVCARAALAIDNARQYTRERDAALTLQRTFLPRSLPPQNAVEVAWRHDPATGRRPGDWFDVIPVSGARVALVAGRTAGQGIGAAAAMGQLRMTISTLAAQDFAPDELLGRLHDMVTAQTGQPATEADPATGPGPGPMQGATCTYAVYDPLSRRCTVALAGQLPPVIVDPHGTVTIPDAPQGPALGTGHPPYRTFTMTLPEASTLVLCTTSPTGPGHGVCLTAAAVREALGGDPQRPLDAACAALAEAHHSDDAGFLVLLARTRSLAADRSAVMALPSDPEVVATARSWSLRQLALWGLEELGFVTELIVSELVTNTIRHAAEPITLRLIHDRTLICEVSDGSSTAPHLRYAYESDEGGRGLFLIAQLAHRWGTRYSDRGKTIWTEQLLPRSGPGAEDATGLDSH